MSDSAKPHRQADRYSARSMIPRKCSAYLLDLEWQPDLPARQGVEPLHPADVNRQVEQAALCHLEPVSDRKATCEEVKSQRPNNNSALPPCGRGVRVSPCVGKTGNEAVPVVQACPLQSPRLHVRLQMWRTQNGLARKTNKRVWMNQDDDKT